MLTFEPTLTAFLGHDVGELLFVPMLQAKAAKASLQLAWLQWHTAMTPRPADAAAEPASTTGSLTKQQQCLTRAVLQEGTPTSLSSRAAKALQLRLAARQLSRPAHAAESI